MSGDFNQLDTERKWLRGELLDPFLPQRNNLRQPRALAKIAERVENVLVDPELASFLGVLERYNRDHSRATRKRASTPFLVGPYLRQVICSVEERYQVRAQFPALERSPAEVRAHFQSVSVKAKALSHLLQKGPQPAVILAPYDITKEAVSLFQVFPSLQSNSKSTETIPLHRLLQDAALLFDSVARRVGRAKQNLQSVKTGTANQRVLRSRAVSLLVRTFRKRFGRPYLVEVATIAQILSGIETDKEYVKKVDQRQRAQRDGDTSP